MIKLIQQLKIQGLSGPNLEFNGRIKLFHAIPGLGIQITRGQKLGDDQNLIMNSKFKGPFPTLMQRGRLFSF